MAVTGAGLSGVKAGSTAGCRLLFRIYLVIVTGVLSVACAPSGTESDVDNEGGRGDAAIAVDDVVPARMNESVTINVLANDSLENSSAIGIAAASQLSQNNGNVTVGRSLVGGNWTDTVTYTPAGGFVGTDRFTYTITNGQNNNQNNNATATVTINVNNGIGGDGILPKPVIAPGGGTYFSVMQVYIFSVVVDAQVWYSTDGSTDIADMQILEDDYILVDKSMTLTAIATKDGFEASEPIVANFSILIPGGTPGDETGDDGTQAPPFEMRVNAGGSAYTDSSGNAWLADQGFSSGQAVVSDGAIGSTSDPIIYQSARSAAVADNLLTYNFEIDNGGYFVRLHFAEFDDAVNAAGDRVFDINVEQSLAVDDFDIFAEAGKFNAHIVYTYAWIDDGVLDISFQGQTGSPVISGIEILGNGGFGGPGNIPPIAVLLATPSSGAAPLEVELDASNSEDPESEPLTFSWDLDEDGEFNDATGAIVTFTYTEPGIYTPQVQVSDGENTTTTFTKIVIPDTSGDGTGDTSPPPDTGPGEPIEITPETLPTDGETGVDANVTITALLSGIPDVEQIYWGGITLTSGSGFISGQSNFDNEARLVEFIPGLPLTPGSTFTATLNASLGFADGSWSMASFTWQFTTAQ